MIYADGRIIITDPTGRLPPLRRQLTAENVKTFLDFAVNDHHYYELSTDKLNRLISSGTRFRGCAADHRHADGGDSDRDFEYDVRSSLSGPGVLRLQASRGRAISTYAGDFRPPAEVYHRFTRMGQSATTLNVDVAALRTKTV